MKLKDHIIHSKESSKPALECLEAIVIGMSIPVFLAIVVRLISEVW